MIINKEFMLFHNAARENAGCSVYPYKKLIRSVNDLCQAILYDHVCAKYIRNCRKKDNFEWADCSMFDVDNMETDNPDEWIKPEDIQKVFSGVPCYISYSRNNMKEKNGKSPRPKFHVYFPHERITDVREYGKFKDKVCEFFRGFDINAKDSARFFFGVEKPVVRFYDGQVLLSEFMNNISANHQERKVDYTENSSDIIPEGQRNRTLCRYASKVLTRWGEKDNKAYNLFIEESMKCRPLLEEKEIYSIWNGSLKFYRKKIADSPDYIQPENFPDRQRSLKPSDFTDIGQAYIFAEEYGDITAYSAATEYLFYNGKVWTESEIKVHGLVQQLTKRQLEESIYELRTAQDDENRAAVKNDREMKRSSEERIEQAKKYRKYVLRNRDTRRITAILREIQPMIELDVNLLDKQGNLLNTPDGTVDLYTGELRKHDPKDYCTKITGTGFSEEGKEIFEQFLKVITCHDNELQDYLQMIAGRSAVGKVYEENLVIAYGNGKNGKSTFFNLISKVMGTYSGHLSSETLLSHPTKNKSPEYAELRGKRLVTVSELDEDKFLDTAIMKKICSTDEMYAEKKYKAPFSFTPSHTIILCTNHLPRVNMSDSGTWRRLLVVPFNAVIKDSEEHKNYTEYLFENAGGAVLAWLIEGAKKFLASGGRIELPEVVKKATEEFREENDWLNNYISECCERGDNYQVSAGDLYQDYREFCKRTGEMPKSQQAFGKALNSGGFRKGRTGTMRYWKGLKLQRDLPDYSEIQRNWGKIKKMTDDDGIYDEFPEEDVVF